MSELCALMDIERKRTSPYHPECDGLSERFNRTLESMLACFTNEEQNDWDQWLQQLKFAYVTSVHSTTGLTPFEVLYGRKPNLPVDLLCPSIKSPHLDITEEEYVGRLQKRLKKIYE